jgi:hypothetical protein
MVMVRSGLPLASKTLGPRHLWLGHLGGDDFAKCLVEI